MAWRLQGGFGMLAVVACMYIVASSTGAATLVRISDTIANSAPNATTTHTIRFTTTQAVPPSGKIVIALHPMMFDVPLGFDYDDADLAVSSGGPFIDRTLAAVASATEDGVAVVGGSSGTITITLNSTSGIADGETVEIELGSNATYGVTGNSLIANPGSLGSYRVDVATQDAGGVMIETGRPMIAVVDAVSVTATSENVPPTRSNGLPSGTVAAGNSLIEISLETDESATCRYATSTGVMYENMTGTLTGVSGVLHIATLSGFQNNTAYSYYVRCVDTFGAVNPDDYPISFTLDADPISNTSIPSLFDPAPGPFPGGSDVLYLSNVSFAGSAPPQSTVTILKDGVYASQAQASSDGTFSATIAGLERGVYTFLVYATDSAARKSSSVPSTLTLGQGSNNSISGMLIPPTIAIPSESMDAPEDVRAQGAGIRGSTIELTLRSASSDKKYTTTIASTTSNGAWEIVIPSRDLSRGTYSLRATALASGRASQASETLSLVVGSAPAAGEGGTSDINGDSKINLVDFSIFLLSWNSSDPASDFNGDGLVNLADFSILLFNWTG